MLVGNILVGINMLLILEDTRTDLDIAFAVVAASTTVAVIKSLIHSFLAADYYLTLNVLIADKSIVADALDNHTEEGTVNFAEHFMAHSLIFIYVAQTNEILKVLSGQGQLVLVFEWMADFVYVELRFVLRE